MSKVLLVVLIVLTVSGFGYFYFQIQDLRIISSEPAVVNTISNSDGVDYSLLIKEEVATAVATLSAQPKATTKPAATSKPSTQAKTNQTTYIPLNGTFTTTNTDWTDAVGTDVYMDLVNDYSADAYVTFEATIKIANASGTVSARLYDATHGIVVNGSEISTGSGSFATVISGNLPLWRGNNLYRVQIKSLNSQEASFGNGRIKITY